MEEDVASQTIGYGEASSSREQLRERYPFIEKALVKAGVDPSRDDLFGNAARAYHRARMASRVALYQPGEMPGFRASAIALRRRFAYFAGVRDDGTVETARMTGPEPKGESDPKDLALLFYSRFSDPTKIPLDESPRNAMDENARLVRHHDWFSFSPRSKRLRHLARDQSAVAANYVLETIPPADLNGTARHHAANLLMAASAYSYQQRLGAASAHLMRNLDPEVSRIMRSTASYEPGFANWLAGESIWEGRRRTVESQRARNRQQAVSSFPVLARSLHEKAMGNADNNEMAAVVDEGRPLLPFLASSYGIKPATLRRIQGMSWQRMGRDMHHDPRPYLSTMDQLAPEHIPLTRRGAADLMTARSAAHVVAEVTGTPRSESFKAVGSAFEKVAHDAEGNPPSGINDLHNYLKEKLIRPGLIQRQVRAGKDVEEACRFVNGAGVFHDPTAERIHLEEARPLEGISVRPALQASARWHRALPRHEDELVTHGSDMQWKPLTGSIDLGGGITAHELTSQRLLKTEGIRQDHCVGGYTDSVLEGKSLIYSLRKGDRILSTVEFDPDLGAMPGKGKPVIVQNFGRENTKASPEAARAARALARTLAKLPDERRQEYAGHLSEQAKKRSLTHSQREIATDRIGYDPTDRPRLEKAWESLSGYLPKPARKLGLDGFIAREEKRLLDHAAKRESERRGGGHRPPFDMGMDMDIPF